MGSFTSNKIWEYDGYGNRRDRYMYVTVSQTKGTATENKSTINWTIYTDGASYWADTGPTTLIIGEEQRYYKERTSWSTGSFPVANGSVSGSFTVNHNSDGTAPDLSVSLSSAINVYAITTVSGTLEMDSIDRYFSETPSFTLSSKDETSFTFDWSTSETCTKVRCFYKLSTESNYTELTSAVYDNATGTTSGTFTLIGNTNKRIQPGVSYDIYIKAKRKDSGLESDSAAANYSTYNYPYIRNITNTILTIGNQQIVRIYNPLNRNISFYMRQNNISGSVLFSRTSFSPGSGTNISYNFTPTPSTLYKSIPTSQTGNAVYYCVYTDSNGTHQSQLIPGTYQIIGTEVPYMPSTMFNFSEGNSTVSSVVGAGNFVQLLSEFRALVSSMPQPASGAGEGPDFKITNCIVTINGSYQQTITGVNQLLTWNGLNVSGDVVIQVTATDSRGLTNTASWRQTFYPYTYPTISGTAARVNNYGEIVNIAASYTSSLVTIEGTNKNGIKVQYSGANQNGYLVGSASSYGNAGSSSASGQLTGISNNTPYTFTFTITDKFGKSATGTATLPIGQPLVFIDSEQMGVGINKFPTSAGLDVTGVVKTNAGVILNNQWTLSSNNSNELTLSRNSYSIKAPQSKSGTLALTSDIPTFDPLDAYPINSIYESTSNTNPATLFGGTWTCIHDDYDIIYLNSQVVYDYVEQSILTNQTIDIALQGAYTGKFYGLENGFTVPPGYTFKYRWTASIQTDSGVDVSVKVNNIFVTGEASTWSNTRFRTTIGGGFFVLGEDILPSPTTDIGYTTDGYIHYIHAHSTVTGDVTIRVWDVTMHLYAVSNDKIYRWKRIS